ncbi:MAG: hypothetical protein R3C16_04815 [Hyphomonadaceae bacterium]
MAGLQAHNARHAAGAPHHRQIGVVDRFEQNHFVAGLDERQQRGGDGFRGAGGDRHFTLPIQRNALVRRVVFRDGFAQVGQAAHGRILVRPVDARARGRFADVERPVLLREALPQIDRTTPAARRDITSKIVVPRAA